MRKKLTLILIVVVLVTTISLSISIGEFVYDSMETQYDNYSNAIVQEVENRFKSFYVMTYIVETQIEDHLLVSASNIADELLKYRSDYADLPKNVLELIAERNSVDDIYIVDSDTVIVNSTLSEDIGYRLGSASTNFEIFLNNLYGSGKSESHKLSTAPNTPGLKKFAYFSPEGSDYIFECSINIADYLRRKFDNEALGDYILNSNLSGADVDKVFVDSVDFFIGNRSVLDNSVVLDPELMNQLKLKNKVSIIEGDLHNIYTRTEFHEQDDYFTVYVTKVVMDFSERRQYMSMLWIRVLISMLVVILVMTIATHFLFNRQVLSRVEIIEKGLAKIADGDLKQELYVKGDDELEHIANDINLMREKLLERDEELLVNKEDLEIIVEDRTRELRSMLDDMESFGTALSHDLRSPINNISQSLEIIEMEIADGKTENLDKWFEIAKGSAKKMGLIIEDLMRLARANEKGLQTEIFDFSLLAQDVFTSLIREKRFESVENDIKPGISACGDPGLVRMILTNLLGNALKYSSNVERPFVEVGYLNDEGAFYVKDSGVGFDSEKLQRNLFKPFQRFHDSREFPGIGIGLVTVKRIVDKHGGRIWAESKPERGATFYFTLSRRC